MCAGVNYFDFIAAVLLSFARCLRVHVVRCVSEHDLLMDTAAGAGAAAAVRIF